MCDLVCALYGALAAVAALYERRQTGKGQFIDVSLLEAGVSFAIWEAGSFFATGDVPQPSGSAHQSAAPYQAFRAADGWLTIGATTKPNWTALCIALDLERLLKDERYVDSNARHRNREALAATIESVTSTKSVDHWLSVLGEAGVPSAPIQDFGQVFTDPHLLARQYFWDAPHPKVGPARIADALLEDAGPARHGRSAAGPGHGGPAG
jgi:formyl-CoA transferase